MVAKQDDLNRINYGVASRIIYREFDKVPLYQLLTAANYANVKNVVNNQLKLFEC